MKTNTNDQKLEILLKEIVSAAAADEATIDEVAASPDVWNSVRRQIRQQEAPFRFSYASIRNWLFIGVPTLAAAGLLFVFLTYQPTVVPTTSESTANAGITETEKSISTERVGANTESEVTETIAKSVESKKVLTRFATPKLRRYSAKASQAKRLPTPAESGIKSEFIALSYARDPESGQIVRVKVPRSMMVSVGLVAAVEKPASLVDAEVLIGDDGLARSIRFIR